jgi:hypothetical protein
MSAIPWRRSNGSGLTRPPSIRARAPKRSFLKHYRVLTVEIGGDDLERDREVREIGGDSTRHQNVEQHARLEQRGAQRKNAQQGRRRARCHQLAKQPQPLAQDHLALGANLLARKA